MRHVFEDKYDFIQIWKYAQQPIKRIKDALDSIGAMGSDCLFFQDINRSPCVSKRKEDAKSKYGPNVVLCNIVIVVKEIEAWYLAGLDEDSCRDLGIPSLASTTSVTKEQFDRLIPTNYDMRVDFMREVLKRFSVETAKQKNKSFAYFMNKISNA